MSHQPLFDGYTYEHELDGSRLMYQLNRVKAVLEDGAWHTDDEISRITGDPSTSVGARRRDLRKKKHGEFIIQSKRAAPGYWVHRMVVPSKQLVLL